MLEYQRIDRKQFAVKNPTGFQSSDIDVRVIQAVSVARICSVGGFSLSIGTNRRPSKQVGACCMTGFSANHGNFYRPHAGVSSKVAISKIGHMGSILG